MLFIYKQLVMHSVQMEQLLQACLAPIKSSFNYRMLHARAHLQPSVLFLIFEYCTLWFQIAALKLSLCVYCGKT